MRRTVSTEVVEKVFWEVSGNNDTEYTFTAFQHIRDSRWTKYMWFVMRHDDGSYWAMEYQESLTEDQSVPMPWETNASYVDLVQVEPHEVKMVEWREVKDA